MKGFNQGAIIPKRDLGDVIPMRFNLIVKLHPEKEPSEYIVMPESAKRVKDSTRGWFGTVMAVGASIPKMAALVGKIKPGTVCMFDESVSIDDPNRCFDGGKNGDERFVMFDIETVMGIRRKNGKIEMLSDRVLARRPKVEDFKITASKLWVPVGHQAQQKTGGVVVAVGPGIMGSKGRLPMDFKPGDYILWGKYAVTDIKIDGVDHVVVRQDKILAKVKGEADRIKFQ